MSNQQQINIPAAQSSNRLLLMPDPLDQDNDQYGTEDETEPELHMDKLEEYIKEHEANQLKKKAQIMEELQEHDLRNRNDRHDQHNQSSSNQRVDFYNNHRTGSRSQSPNEIQNQNLLGKPTNLKQNIAKALQQNVSQQKLRNSNLNSSSPRAVNSPKSGFSGYSQEAMKRKQVSYQVEGNDQQKNDEMQREIKKSKTKHKKSKLEKVISHEITKNKTLNRIKDVSPRSSFLQSQLPTIDQEQSDLEDKQSTTSNAQKERNRRNTALSTTSASHPDQDLMYKLKQQQTLGSQRNTVQVSYKAQKTLMQKSKTNQSKKSAKDQEQEQKQREDRELEQVIQAIEQISKQRLLRANTAKKIQQHLQKYQIVVEQIVSNRHLPENKQILEEADNDIKIPKVYSSFKNPNQKQERHGLPLYFYLRRKIFEQQYQDFLILVRKGNFVQAYEECAKDSFQKAFDYQIKNMMVFEEFFKKNEYNLPKKLLENYAVKATRKNSLNLNDLQNLHKQGHFNNGTTDDNNNNSGSDSHNNHHKKQHKIDESFYRCGYSIKNDYLFDFVKKMVMLSHLAESEHLLRDQLKEKDQSGKELIKASIQFSFQIHKKHQKSQQDEKLQLEKNIQRIMAMQFKKRFNGNDPKETPGQFVQPDSQQNISHSNFNETSKFLAGNLLRDHSPMKEDSPAKQTARTRQNIVQPQPLNTEFHYNMTQEQVQYHEEKVGKNGTVNEISNKLRNIKHYKDSLHDQKSFYNKKVLLNIIENDFYNRDDESIILALYLLCHQEKRADQCIELILKKGGQFMNKLNSFSEEGDNGNFVDQLNDMMMSEPKIIRRVVREAIKQNEPEIAILAGKELCSEQVGEDLKQQGVDEIVYRIIDFRCLIENLGKNFENDRMQIINKKKELKDMRKSIANPLQLMKKLGHTSKVGTIDVSSQLSEEQKRLQYLESNRRWMIEERSLELKERLKVLAKKNILKTLIKYLRYFIKNHYQIDEMSVNDFIKDGGKKKLSKGISMIVNDGLNLTNSPMMGNKNRVLGSTIFGKSDDNYSSHQNLIGKSKLNAAASENLSQNHDDCKVVRLCFLTIMQRALEIKSHLDKSGNPLGFEIEYFLRKLLKWEMRQYRKLKVKDDKINSYCYNIIKCSVENDKPFIAEMVLYLRKRINTEMSFQSNIAIISDDYQSQILQDDECEEILKMLLKNPNCEKLELILEILQLNKSSKKVLKRIYHYIVASEDDQTASKIIQEKKSLLIEGRFIYYCAEILAQVDVKDLDQHYSKEIVLNLSKFCKSNEIKYCHSPYLALILIAEFVKKLSKADVLHSNILLTALNQVLDLALCFQKSVKNEKRFKYIHQMKDLRNREVLDIIVENQFYELLQNDDIGMIAEDLWRGTPAVSVWGASSIRQFIQLEVFDDQIQLFKPLNPSQRYIFQFDNWKQSCLHRYIAEAFSIFMLAIYYQIVRNDVFSQSPHFQIVYMQINNDTIDDTEKDNEILVVQILAQIWIYSAFLSQIMQLIYSQKTKKKFQIDWWRFIDFLLFTMCIIDSLRIHLYFFPIQKDETPYKSINVEDPEEVLIEDNVYNRHILNSVIISIIVFLVWIRIISVLITTQQLGHMIQAIYFMIKMTINFLIIFACWLICSSAIFTAIYYDSGSSNGSYRSFSVTVTTLFSASLAVYDDQFTILEPLGSILLSIYVIISAVMLINLLIALLTEAFSAISKQADSRHRAILINYRHRWGWHESQSYLIFAPPPLNLISVPLIPFGLFMQNKKMAVLNNFYCKTMFFFVYVLPMVIAFTIFNLIIMIFAWFKGFYTIKSLIFKNRTFFNLLLWTFFGLFILIGVTIKDLYYIMHISIESLAFRRRKKGNKQVLHLMELDRLKSKQSRETKIYTNFIKSVINLFDEFDFQSEGSLHLNSQKGGRSSLISNRASLSQGRLSNLQRNSMSGMNKSMKQTSYERLVEIRIFASRFYRMLEDKEEHKRDVKNPARALKGKRKKRPKIFQNFIQENSKEVQIDLMQCYFFKKYWYRSKEVFDRAYYADFNAIDKAIHKYRQKSALQKQGQNLKKINESCTGLKDQLMDYNNKGNLSFISENLIDIMAQKIEEAERQINSKKEQRKSNKSRGFDDISENDGEYTQDDESHHFSEDSSKNQNFSDKKSKSGSSDSSDSNSLSNQQSYDSEEEDAKKLQIIESQEMIDKVTKTKSKVEDDGPPPLLTFTQEGSMMQPTGLKNSFGRSALLAKN